MQQMLCAKLRQRGARAPLRRLLAEITGAPQREWLALCHAASLTPASNAAAAAEAGQGGLNNDGGVAAAAVLPRRAMREVDLATEIARLLSQLLPAAMRGGGAIASPALPAPPASPASPALPHTHTAASSSLDATPPPKPPPPCALGALGALSALSALRGGALLGALPEAFAAAHAAQEAELRYHEPLPSGVAVAASRRAEGAAGTRECAARAVVDAEEASCALRLALRRQTELQVCPMPMPMPMPMHMHMHMHMHMPAARAGEGAQSHAHAHAHACSLGWGGASATCTCHACTTHAPCTCLQGTGLSCSLPPGEDVQYLGERGGSGAAGAAVFGSVAKALPVPDMAPSSSLEMAPAPVATAPHWPGCLAAWAARTGRCGVSGPSRGGLPTFVPCLKQEEPSYTVLLQDGKTREVPLSL